MRIRRIARRSLIGLTLLLIAPGSSAQSFNVDLGEPFGRPASSLGAAAGQTGTWNWIGSEFTRLADIEGVLSGVYASVTAGSYAGNAGGCEDEELLSLIGDNIYTIGGAWSVVLEGLSNGEYVLYLYAPYNSIVPTGVMVVNGTPVPSIGRRSCVLTENSTYVRVPVTVTDGTLTVTGESAGAGSSAGLAGLQLVQTAVAPRDTPPPLTVTTFAGMAEPSDNNSSPGAVDGPGPVARFGHPFGLTTGPAGNVYVADTENHTIRRIAPTGMATTLAGVALHLGDADGPSSAARFNQPNGVAVDRHGNVYVADTYNHTIRRISPRGMVSTFAGRAGKHGTADGVGSAARFLLPFGIATDAAGNVYVADTQNHTIRRITPEGVVTTLAGLAREIGNSDGMGSAARFNYPGGVAIDGAGNVYVGDYVNHAIRKITPTGTVTTLAGLSGNHGAADGPGSVARFTNPAGVAVDSSGNVYVADQGNNTIRRVTPSGETSTIAGTAPYVGRQDAIGAAAGFYRPSGVALDGDGNLYVADKNHSWIRRITPAAEVSTIAGRGRSSGHVDGTGNEARFHTPIGLAADESGNLYVADTYNHAIRKVTPTAVVTTVAGITGAASLVIGSGNVFVASAWTHTIWKVAPDGQTSLVAGTENSAGSVDGTGTAARFDTPLGIAIDANANLFVADAQNHTIRKITPAGVVTTFAGAAGVYGSIDGAGGDARFDSPYGLAFDRDGNLFVSETYNGTIRKITPAGVVSTFAGQAGQHGDRDGPATEALLGIPEGIAFDRDGNLWVADASTFGGGIHAIRKITPAGFVTTVAGLPGVSGSADGAGRAARFSSPSGIATDDRGNVYVADPINDSIRKITPTLADTATVDHSPAVVGETRLLGSAPSSANAWQWKMIRQPAASTSRLSSDVALNPTFTPDAPGLYVFRLVATGPDGASVTSVELTVTEKGSRRRSIRH
ncbi:MAG: NHL repeat-containing protein [Thermoanaerobaculia bacterium]